MKSKTSPSTLRSYASITLVLLMAIMATNQISAQCVFDYVLFKPNRLSEAYGLKGMIAVAYPVKTNCAGELVAIEIPNLKSADNITIRAGNDPNNGAILYQSVNPYIVGSINILQGKKNPSKFPHFYHVLEKPLTFSASTNYVVIIDGYVMYGGYGIRIKKLNDPKANSFTSTTYYKLEKARNKWIKSADVTPIQMFGFVTAPSQPLPTITSKASGDWNDPNTWEGGTVPTANHNVGIKKGTTVTVSSAVQLNAERRLVVFNGATLQLAAGGNLTCNGTTHNLGNLIVDAGSTLNAGGAFIHQGTQATVSGTILNKGYWFGIGPQSNMTILQGGVLDNQGRAKTIAETVPRYYDDVVYEKGETGSNIKLEGKLLNYGILRMAPGATLLNKYGGEFSNQPSGVLEIQPNGKEIGINENAIIGPGSVINIKGSASLGGSLKASLPPTAIGPMTIVQAASISGTFGEEDLTNCWGTAYDAKSLKLNFSQGSQTFYKDADRDGFGDAAQSTTACPPPANYVKNNTDCNDADNNINVVKTWYLDLDNDRYGGYTVLHCDRPANGKLLSELEPGSTGTDDCNDNDPSSNPATNWFIDKDNDGYGFSLVEQCNRPNNGKLLSELIAGGTGTDDCDDDDASIHPGATEILGNGKDEDCNGTPDDGGRIYVDANAAIGGNGTSWSNAYNALQNALNDPKIGNFPGGCDIWVAAGTYKPTTGTSRNESFTLLSSVRLYGGFVGGESLLTQRNPTANPTELSGEINSPGLSDNSLHVLTCLDATGVILDGFTVRDGNADLTEWGGGLNANRATLLLTNCIFKNNASVNGGAVSSINGKLAATNCAFYGNNATDQGGGIFLQDKAGNAQHAVNTIMNCSFSGNGAAADKGSAIHTDSAYLDLMNSVLWGNLMTTGSGSKIEINDPTSPLVAGDRMPHYYNSCIVEGGITNGIDCLDKDPLFVLQPTATPPHADGDLRLKPCSPAINQGLQLGGDTYVPDWDFGLEKRGLDGGIDLGFDEAYGGGLTIYVNANVDKANPSRTEDGTSWDNAYIDLNQALNQASKMVGPDCENGIEVWVAKGAYKPDSSDASISFSLINGVSIMGGFSGTEQSILDRDLTMVHTTNETVLNGDLNNDNSVAPDGRGDFLFTGYEDNSLNIVIGTPGIDRNAALDGFTIVGGKRGMQNDNASPTVRDCSFLYNYNDGTNGTGGAMHNERSAPEIIGCLFKNNKCIGNGGAIGFAGVPDSGDESIVEDCQFQNNLSEGNGGAVYSGPSSYVQLKYGRFLGNRSKGDGGGLSNEQASTKLYQCQFVQNHSEAQGGGASSQGAGFFLLANSSFAGNAADLGGAVTSQRDTADFINTTFCGNTASTNGGGIAIGDSSALVNIANCIIWGNTASATSTAPNLYNHAGAMPTLRFSILEGFQSGTASANIFGNVAGKILDIDPLFIAPPTNLRLQDGSPAINAGDNNWVVPYTSDLDKTQRVKGANVDMGAYEKS